MRKEYSGYTKALAILLGYDVKDPTKLEEFRFYMVNNDLTEADKMGLMKHFIVKLHEKKGWFVPSFTEEGISKFRSLDMVRNVYVLCLDALRNDVGAGKEADILKGLSEGLTVGAGIKK